jgi:hypothetical protein
MGILDDIAAKTSGGGGGILDRLAGTVDVGESKMTQEAALTAWGKKGEEQPTDTRKISYTGDSGAKESIKRGVKASMPYVRPVLEGGGAAIGSIAGAAAGAPTIVGAPIGGVAGAATGYASGKYLADALEGAPQSAPQTLADLGTGAMYEMGGQAVGPALGLAGKGVRTLADTRPVKAITTPIGKVKDAISRNTPPVTEQGIRSKAAEIIKENTGQGAVYEKNAADAAKLNVPGYKPSLGEARNDPGLIKLQRSIERQPGTAGNIIMEQKGANQAAVKDYLENEFKGTESIDDVVTALSRRKAEIEATTGQAEASAAAVRGALNPADKQTIGRGISDELDDAMKPLKEAEREAWGKVPNYPIPTQHFDEAADQLRLTPLEADTELAVNKILDYAKRMPKTTEGLQSIERTINDKMFAPNADPNVKRVLGSLKKAIGDDFKAMGEAADAGDIAIFEGKVVNPSKLQAERQTLLERIERDKAAAVSTPDIPSITKALREAGDPPNQWMKQVNETAQQYSSRLVSRYNSIIGDAHPTLSAEQPASVIAANERIAAIDAVLEGATPADDVATAYRAAKDVSKERFDRFGKGAVAEIGKGGNQATGNRLPDALIPAKVFSLDGADDFIRAVGKEKAATHADQYAAQDLLAKANPMTGEIPAKAVAAWLQKNMTVLRKYGISSKYGTVAKAQGMAEAARMQQAEFNHSIAAKILGSDPDKAIASAMQGNAGMHGGGVSAKNTSGIIDDLMEKVKGSPQAVKGLQNAFKDFLVDKVETTAKTISGDAIISPAAIQKELVKYAPAMRRLYANDPGKIAALQKVSKAVEIQSRSAKSPIGGGSDTAENLNMSRSILGRVVDIIPGGGMVRGLARAGLGKINDMTAQEVNKVIARALYDPELAQTLVLASKRYKPQVVEKRFNSHLITMGLAAMTDEEK